MCDKIDAQRNVINVLTCTTRTQVWHLCAARFVSFLRFARAYLANKLSSCALLSPLHCGVAKEVPRAQKILGKDLNWGTLRRVLPNAGRLMGVSILVIRMLL